MTVISTYSSHSHALGWTKPTPTLVVKVFKLSEVYLRVLSPSRLTDLLPDFSSSIW